MRELIGIIVIVLCFIAPGFLLLADFIHFLRKKENVVFESIMFTVGGIDMAVAYFFWDLPEYTVALNKYGSISAHEPFSRQHLATIIVISLVGLLSYLILKFTRKKLPPLAEVFLLASVYVSCTLQLFCMVQLLCGPHPLLIGFNGSDLFFCVVLCVVPTLFLLHVAELMVKLFRERAKKQETIQYENAFLRKVNVWFIHGVNLFAVAVVLMLPILGILVMILCLFGQQPDSVILAFTKTSDWVFSKEVAPPPLAYDEHYLCTVSLRGHPGLVKPIRCGIRRGNKIIVNRQLCIANAFEELIMEKTPRFHKAIRIFYDTYGYPISRFIKKAWVADMTYIVMKPLEWIFVVILYLFDIDPETRICRQYLPKDCINKL